jgi:ABC-type dipeptide/oligopeptide/nickel transport system ATPase subunit
MGRELGEPGNAEKDLEESISQQRSLIETFLKGRGLSPENLNDIAAASQQKASFEERLRVVEQGITQFEGEIGTSLLSDEPRINLEEQVKKILGTINAQFGGGAVETRRIELRYAYDTVAAEDKLIDWLLNDLEQAMPGSRPRVDHARMVLEHSGALLTTEGQDLIDSIRKDPSKTGQVLDLYFSRPPRLDVWDVMRKRMLADVLQFMRLEVLYDGKALDRTSFGQRCSAVLVVLLSLGNGPIVVDEPEAHLDSALIANFMVDLVKRVKQHRQVVFATHNANFVVNGDSELVHALSADTDGQTTVRSTTLEDLTTRSLILALEGGEVAFKLREGRYGLEP